MDPDPVPPPAPSPAAIPEPAAPSVPSLPSAAVRVWKEGTCHDCQPGESAFSIDAAVGPGTGQCSRSLENDVRAALEELASHAELVSSFHGPLVSSTVDDLLQRLPAAEARSVAERLGPYTGESASCQVVVAVLPAGAKFTGYRYEARDFEAGGDCLPDQDCPIGSARWIGNPFLVRGEGYTVVFAVFSNRAGDRVRYPGLSVYFRGRVPGRG